jgi:hypothetical protein
MVANKVYTLPELLALTAKYEKLWAFCQKFIDEQGIVCAETVYQSDDVILDAYEFIEGVADIVGYKEIK